MPARQMVRIRGGAHRSATVQILAAREITASTHSRCAAVPVMTSYNSTAGAAFLLNRLSSRMDRPSNRLVAVV